MIKYVFLISILAMSLPSFAQPDNGLDFLKNVIPPSPNAASLGKYGDLPVSLNTGLPSISIPLCELKGRSLSVPVSLSYHASGIKVADIASWVGTGWALEAGGLITRSVRGLPDDLPTWGSLATRKLFADYNTMWSNPSNTTWKNLVVQASNNDADGEHDTYYLNAMGKNYKLLLKYVGQNLEVETIPYSNLKIIPAFQNSLSGSWTVIMEDGTKLLFGGLTSCVEVTSSSRFGNLVGNLSFATSWHLQKITSPTGEVINFTYQQFGTIAPHTFFSQKDNIQFPCEGGVAESGITSTLESQTISSILLSQITSETGSVKFIPKASARLDLPGTYALHSVQLWSNTKKIDEYILKTNDAPTGPGTEMPIGLGDYNHHRLRLDTIEHRGMDLNQRASRWVLTYDSQNLPSVTSFAQDHFGYYNSATSNASLLPKVYISNPFIPNPSTGFFPPVHLLGGNRDCNPTAMQAGVLTKISYPTGGYTQFNYEPHMYTAQAETFKDTLMNHILNITYNQTPFVSFKSAQFQITKPQYVLLSIQSVISTSLAAGHLGVNGRVEILDPNGNQLGAPIALMGTTTAYFDLRLAGTYTFKVSTNAIASDFVSASDYINLNAQLTYSRSWGIKNVTRYAGGLRIKSIIDYDGYNPALNKERYFKYYDPLVLNDFNPERDYVTVTSEMKDRGNGSSCEWNHVWRNSSTSFALGSGSSGLAYGRVITEYGLNGTNGKTQTTFLNYLDVDVSGTSKQFPFVEVDNRDWKRGLMIDEITWDASGNKVSRKMNSYAFIPRTQLSFFKAGVRTFVPHPICTDPLLYCGISTVQATLTTEQVNVTSSKEISYFKNGATYDSLYTATNYFYDNPKLVSAVRTTSTDSRGLLRRKMTLTALDSARIIPTGASTTPYYQLAKRNILTPLLVIDSIGTKLLQRTLTNFAAIYSPALNANIYLPDNIKTKNDAANGSWERRAQFVFDPANGNIKEQLKEKDVRHAYLYDYNNALPIAEATNATAASVAYTSFEADGSGNWTINSAIRDAGNACTGSRSYVLGGTSTLVKSGLTSGRSYVVSFWLKNGATATVNTVAPTAGRISNGWTYFERTVTLNATTTAITIAGTGNIDEVRLYPVGALMTTYTYEPSVGIKTANDASNQISYYEYDSFGRLASIRDQQNAILKTYQYNYKQ